MVSRGFKTAISGRSGLAHTPYPIISAVTRSPSLLILGEASEPPSPCSTHQDLSESASKTHLPPHLGVLPSRRHGVLSRSRSFGPSYPPSLCHRISGPLSSAVKHNGQSPSGRSGRVLPLSLRFPMARPCVSEDGSS